MRKVVLSIFVLFSFTLTFAFTLNEAIKLSQNPSTLFRAREEILDLLLSDPASASLLKTANNVYSKVEMLKSATSSPETRVANAIVEENKNEFYSTLASTKISTLPKSFSLVFNVLPIRQDYSNFFSHLSDSDYVGALDYFSKLKYLYKVPELKKFLPQEDIASLWSFFAQGVELKPEIFDVDAARFIVAISTPYDIRGLYMKTYVWLSGLSVPQAQHGLRTVEFESMISSQSNVEMDPNLLQWKYTISRYLSLYTSITSSTRKLSEAKNLVSYVGYATVFYRSIQNFPSQYRQLLSKGLATYLDLLLQKVTTSNFKMPQKTAEEMKKLSASNPNNVNSSKLLAIALTSSSKGANGEKTLVKKEGKALEMLPFSYLYYLFTITSVLVISFLIPRVRLALYRIFKLKKFELGFYMKMISKFPGDFQWHMKIAQLYEKMGKYEESQREYSVAMKLMSVRRQKE